MAIAQRFVLTNELIMQLTPRYYSLYGGLTVYFVPSGVVDCGVLASGVFPAGVVFGGGALHRSLSQQVVVIPAKPASLLLTG